MLMWRVITALVLLPVVLGAVFLTEREVFRWIAGAFFLAAGWEWAGMMRGANALLRTGWCVLLVAVMVLAEHFRPQWLLVWLPLWWLLALVWVVMYPRATAGWYRLPVQAVIGLALLVPSWQAILLVQDQGAVGLGGPWALMFILLWVWAADTGAYFAGRAFGKHKLAPRVSPGKTLEGLVGGIALSLAIVALVGWKVPLEVTAVPLALVAVVTVLASVLGDLFESMAKRQAGIKDSGKILPGHGGMLDRIGSITAALPVAVAAMSWLGVQGGL